MNRNQWIQFVCALLIAFSTVAARAQSVRTGVVMKGTRYATTYYVKTGAQPGPTIVVLGGCHGDEPAGYLAADKIAQWKVTRGTLWVLPRAHKQAIARKVRGYPDNMNNMFPGKADGDDMQKLAHGIWSMIVEAKPDVMISLHESRDFHARDAARFGQTLTYDFPQIKPQMQRALDRTNPDVKPRLHKFLHFIKPFPNCPTYNCWTKLRVPATGIETSKTLPLQQRIRYQLMMSMGFFDEWGLGYQQQDLPRLSTFEKSATSPLTRPIVANETPAKTAKPVAALNARPRVAKVEVAKVESKVPQTEPVEAVAQGVELTPAATSKVGGGFSPLWIVPLSLLGAGLGWLGFQIWSRTERDAS